MVVWKQGSFRVCDCTLRCVDVMIQNERDIEGVSYLKSTDGYLPETPRFLHVRYACDFCDQQRAQV